jgi:hypothetical protein
VEKLIVSDWKSVYPASTTVSTTTTAPFPNIVDSVDLRSEFDNLVLGYGGETPIGQTFILRRMRRDSSNNLVPCICVDELTLEPMRDFPCPVCRGNGNLWDEESITGYKVVSVTPGGTNAEVNLPKSKPGIDSLPSVRFFFSYDADITIEDRIIEIELGADGTAVTPYNRIAAYELMLVRAMRADNGKIEYWICTGQKMGPDTLGEVG